MEENLLQFAVRAFATLMVVVDPLGVAPSFVTLTSEMASDGRRQTLARAVIVAFAVTLFFLLCGGFLLSYLGVTVHAFAISGGILLFAASWPMLFGERGRLQAPERHEPSTLGEDVAIFPLAILLLCGPGTITTILLLTNQAGENISRIGLLAATVAAVYVISWCLLYAAERIIMRIGEGNVRIMTRVLGIILAALAVQYVLNGITGYYSSLTSGSP